MGITAHDERRWTINWTTDKRDDGPRIANVSGPPVDAAEPVEVVPASQLEGAVERVDEAAQAHREYCRSMRMGWARLSDDEYRAIIRGALGDEPKDAT